MVDLWFYICCGKQLPRPNNCMQYVPDLFTVDIYTPVFVMRMDPQYKCWNCICYDQLNGWYLMSYKDRLRDKNAVPRRLGARNGLAVTHAPNICLSLARDQLTSILRQQLSRSR